MFGSWAGAFGACSTGPAGSARPAGVVWLVGASRSCSTAARWSAVSSPQWPNTQITAIVPDGMSPAGPGTGTPPGTGPIAWANADSAVGRSTRPSSPTRSRVNCHADRAPGDGDAAP